MREILFRGKTMNGDWVFGNITILKKRRNHIEAGYYISNSIGFPFAFHVRPETVGEWTGLFDKKKNRIWEGDIVSKLHTDKPYSRKKKSKDVRGIVRYDADQQMGESCFYVYKENDEGYGCYSNGPFDNCEVLGNVFDNPELLVNHNTTQL